ncbi:MAG: T9SS type A sorting domain-containing protein [Bacteroidetes bacterium]|nr:MAG: T9SS type A sorting domain-containing protein [Bacteroidota bacterium]
MKRNFTLLLPFPKVSRLSQVSKASKMIGMLIGALFLVQSFSFGQTVIYTETMDNGGGGSNGDAISVHASNGRFDEATLTYSGTADMRNTLPSSGYTSASGGFNVMFNSTGETFSMNGLDFSACQSEIKLSFGLRKGTNLSDGTSMLIQYNTYDEPTIFKKITFDPLPTGSGTATWYYITSNSLIPSNVKSIRFAAQSAVEMRLDDVEIQCNTVTCQVPDILNEPIDVTSCQNQPVKFGTFAQSTTNMTYQWQVNDGSGFVNVTDGALYTDTQEDSLVINNVTGAMNGYKYRCVATNSCGDSFTVEVTLTVNAVDIPTITASGPLEFCLGGSVTLTSSSATGNEWSTGETTQSITVTGDDEYSVKVTFNNCSETSDPTIVKVNDPSFNMENIQNPTTCISTDGSIDINGSATGMVSWTGPVNGNSGAPVPLLYTIGGLMRGTYTILFEVSPGCSSTETITLVGDIPVPTITASGPLTFCDGDSVILTSSADLGNTWSNGETTKEIIVTTSGTYNVTVTSGTCVKQSTDTVVTVNPKTVLSVTAFTDPTACAVADGSITVGGTGTGNISWTGAATGSMTGVTLPTTISGLIAGSYTIKFNNGLCQSEDIDQTLTDPGAPATPTITASGPISFCDGGSVTLTSSSATNNTWSTGETTQTITVSTTQDVTVSVTVTGCTSTSAVTSVVNNAYPSTPTIAVKDTVNICTGDSVILTSSSLSNNTWSTGSTTRSIVVKTSGTYNVTVDNNGCTTTSADTAITVSATAPLVIGSTTDPSSCGATNGVVQIAGIFGPDPNGTLSWTGAMTGDAGVNPITLPYTVSGLSSGTYDFTFNSGAGCVGTANVTITGPNTPPSISASGPTSICEGGSVVLSSSSAVGNTWSTGETTQNITVNSTGSYTVTVTDNGCTLTSTATDVTVNLKPVLTATMNSPSVCGDSDGSLVIDAAGSGTGNLIWTGAASGSQSGINLPFTVSNLSAGSYQFRFDDGCASNLFNFDVMEASVPSTPVITANGSTTICKGDSVELTSSETNNISWITGETSASIWVKLSGNYTVTVTQGFCTETSDPMSIGVKSLPTKPSISSSDVDNTVCEGTTVTLTSSAGAGSDWSDGSTGASLDVTSSGTFDVSVTNVDGCTATSDPVTVTVNPKPTKPTISADGATTFCDGESVTLTSSATSNIQWSTGANAASISVNSSGTFTVTVTVNGCSSVSDPTSTTMNPNPTAILNSFSPVCDTAANVPLNQGLPVGGIYTVDGTEMTEFDPDPSNVGDHTVVYTVTENGCSGSATTTLTVQNCSGGTGGINEETNYPFVVFPNPSTGSIQIEGDYVHAISSIEVRDQLGRNVQDYGAGTTQVNLNELSNGIYLLVINGENFQETIRIQLNK